MQSPPPNEDQHPSTTPATERGTCTAIAAVAAPPRNPSKDDLDLLLLHVDFPLLLTMAAKAKELRRSGAISASRAPRDPPTIHPNDNAFEAAKRIQSKILSSYSLPVQSSPTILRGQYPMTDVIMDDALMELQDEIDAFAFDAATAKPISPASDDLVTTLLAGSGKRRPAASGDQSQQRQLPPSSIHYDSKKKGDSIAIKYSKWQTDILMGWMIANSESPFPDPCDVAELAAATGLTHSQVVNWTTNVRKRNLKATCRGSKKPHHFIDFLFLKQDRESRLGGGRDRGGVRYPPPEASSALSVPSSAAVGMATRTMTRQPIVSYSDSHGGSHQRARRTEARHAEPRTEPLDDHQLLNEEEVHELEPLEWKVPGQAQTELLQDFANYWTDDDEDSSYLLDTTTSLEVAERKGAESFGDLAWLSSHPAKMPPSAPPARRVTESSPGFGTRQRRLLLPSVTLDSHEDERFGSHEYWAPGAVHSHLANKVIQSKRNRPPTPPPLDELYLYPTDLEDIDGYEPIRSHYVHRVGRYGDNDNDDDDDDDWIRAWDIEEGKPLNLKFPSQSPSRTSFM